MITLPFELLLFIFSYLDNTSKRVISMTIKGFNYDYPMNVSNVCNINMFEWALHMGCPTHNIVNTIVKIGCLETLKIALCKGFKVNQYTCSYAVVFGHLHILKYVSNYGALMEQCLCNYAVIDGYVDILKYLHESGCEITDHTCELCASFGHLDCLKYCINYGCTFTVDTCVSNAIENGHINILKYLYESGYPIDIKKYLLISMKPECIEYLLSIQKIQK